MYKHEKGDASQDDLGHVVLVVDSDSVQLESLSRGLRLHGYNSIRFTNLLDAEVFLNSPLGSGVDVLITDLTKPDNARMQLIMRTRKGHPDLPIVALCGWSATFQSEAAKRYGFCILKRPFDSERLHEVIQNAITK